MKARKRARKKAAAPPVPTTTVGRHAVPLRNLDRCHVLTFSGGARGLHERGQYTFWTAEFKKPVGDRKDVIVRSRVGLAAGERFARIAKDSRASYVPAEDRREYRALWRQMGAGSNVACIRASTLFEVTRWLASHVSDLFGDDYTESERDVILGGLRARA